MSRSAIAEIGTVIGGTILGSAALATGVSTALASVAVGAAVYGISALFATPAAPTQGTGYAGATPASSPVYNITAQGNYARLGEPTERRPTRTPAKRALQESGMKPVAEPELPLPSRRPLICALSATVCGRSLSATWSTPMSTMY